jgi:predicted XRE-type DNA-binding protein
MTRPKRVAGEKPLFWTGSSKNDLLAFPEAVIDEIGTALGLAQFGGKHPSAKPWRGEGLAVFEGLAGGSTKPERTMRFDMPKRKNKTEVVPSSGNVFSDLGISNAEEKQTKVRLAVAINEIVQDQQLSQAAAARRLNVNQPKVSALSNYQLDGFSVERLMNFLTALDRDVNIVIRRKPRSQKIGRILVSAA